MLFNTFIFDIDGTLTDSAPAILSSLQRLLQEETGRQYHLDELEFTLGLPNTELGFYFNIRNWDEILEKGRGYYNLFAPDISLFDGIEETISTLKLKGAHLGIVTSKTHSQYDNGFSRQALSKYFETVICADDTPFFKPHPGPLLECIRQMKVPPKTALFIGDSKNDMLCAKSAGIKGALALWGCRRPEDILSAIQLKTPGELLDLMADIV